MQIKGVWGVPQQAFCNANGVCIGDTLLADADVVYTSALLADAMKPLNVPSKFENHFAIRTVRFQVQLEAGGYFSDLFLLPFQSAFIPFAPCPHGIQNRFQTISQFGQSIFHPGRHFSIDLPGPLPLTRRRLSPRNRRRKSAKSGGSILEDGNALHLLYTEAPAGEPEIAANTG